MGILSDLLYPPKCVLCSRVLERGEIDLCRTCRVEGPEYGNGKQNLQFLDSLTSVWYYEGYVRRSLLRFKFYGKRVYARSYGRLLAAALLREQPGEFDCITWVPTGTWRKLRRGYDQAGLLAQSLGDALGVKPRKLLKKLRDNPAQSGIEGDAQRRANVMGVYACPQKEYVKGKRILLVDDIYTTGATAGECARILRTAGAESVHCAVVAAARKHK